MPEHYTRNTLETTRWCNKCRQHTQWRVSAGRISHCLSCELNAKIQAHGERRKAGRTIPLRLKLG